MVLACVLVIAVRKELLGFESEFLRGGWEGLVDLVLFGAAGFLTALGDPEYFGLTMPKDERDGSALRDN